MKDWYPRLPLNEKRSTKHEAYFEKRLRSHGTSHFVPGLRRAQSSRYPHLVPSGQPLPNQLERCSLDDGAAPSIEDCR